MKKHERDVSWVRVIGEPLLNAEAALDKMPCPDCGRNTLTYELVPRCGVKFWCESLSKTTEDGHCPFEEILFFEDVKRAAPSVVRLAVVPEVPAR